MKYERDLETRAMTDRFAHLADRWSLDRGDIAALIGGNPVERETSMRMLLEIDRIMGILLPDGGVLPWLRDPGPQGLTPLEFLCVGREERRGMLAAARLRHLQLLGHEA